MQDYAGQVIEGVPLLVQLLTRLQPPTKEHAQRASKRPKMDRWAP